MQTLKKPAEFQRVAREGRRWSCLAFTLQVLKKSAAPFRIGFTTSRRVGNAVVRNRARRRLREMVRQCLKSRALEGCDAVLVAKTPAAQMPFDKMSAEFERALAALKVTA